MKTGFSNISTQNDEQHDMLEKLLNIFMKNTFQTAVTYSAYSGRDNLSSTDMIYALQYEAITFLKKYDITDKNFINNLDNLCAESDTESDTESVSDSETEEFVEADSTKNKFCEDVNICHHEWDTWNPDTPIEQALKNSIDKVLREFEVKH